MNILMFDAAYPPPVTGGKEKQAHLLAKTLVSAGHKVAAISYVHNGNKSENVDGVSVERIKPNMFSPFILFFILIKRRFVYSMLHIHTPSRIGKLAAAFGSLLGYKVVFKFPNEKMLDNLTRSKLLVWRTLFRCVSCFVVLEEGTKNKLTKLKVPAKKIFHVPNGVELMPRISNRASTEPMLLFVGRLAKQKCCDQLILACDILRDRKFNFKLVVVGDGPLINKHKLLVRELNLESQIDFVGYQSNVLKFMKEADALVSVSNNEGMANALLEAMSMGLPIVTTDVGSARFQVGEFGSRFLCKVNDPEDIANKIQSLFAEFSLQEEYSEKLYARCSKIFSIDIIAQQYLHKYSEL